MIGMFPLLPPALSSARNSFSSFILLFLTVPFYYFLQFLIYHPPSSFYTFYFVCLFVFPLISLLSPLLRSFPLLRRLFSPIPLLAPFFFFFFIYTKTLFYALSKHPLPVYTTSEYTPSHFRFICLWLGNFHLFTFPSYGNIFYVFTFNLRPLFSRTQQVVQQGFSVFSG